MSILLDGLSEEQQKLIELIGRPWMVGQTDDTHGWPVWEFVRRRFRQENPGSVEAEDVLKTLPYLRSDLFAEQEGEGTYGLFWTGIADAGARLQLVRPAPAIPLTPGSRIGLTIAGLGHLPLVAGSGIGCNYSPALLAVRIVADVAAKEAALAGGTDWWHLTEDDYPLREGYFDTKGFPGDHPVELLGHVFQAEFWSASVRSISKFNYSIRYGTSVFRRFDSVDSVQAYVQVVDQEAAQTAPPRVPRSPLGLPASLDYLGLVLRNHPEWPADKRFLDLPSFQAAADIATQPATMVEFEQRTGELWNVFTRLKVPTASEESFQARGFSPTGNWKSQSLNHLQVWLIEQLGNETYVATGCGEALALIRQIGRIRQGSAHAGSETANTAAEAKAAFKLPSLVVDWSEAWTIVTSQVAGALYAIAIAVRSIS